MRDAVADETFLRTALAGCAQDTLYITRNAYDGGYEIRLGSVPLFVDDDVIDTGDVEEIRTRYARAAGI